MMASAKSGFLLTCVVVVVACNDRQHPRATLEASSTANHAESARRSNAPPAGQKTVSAVDVVRYYYDAIGKRQYDTAYALWEQSGEASGQTRSEFTAGFAQTASVRASIGESVRLEGAAGSQYATVPVTVDAVLNNGARQHFAGFYTLRRAMVDGATPEQRRWHIYLAHLR